MHFHVKTLIKSQFVAGLVLLTFTGCSMMTARGREQRRYQNYVRKSSITRRPSTRVAQKGPSIPASQQMPSEPTERTTTSEGPQSVTSDSNASPQ